MKEVLLRVIMTLCVLFMVTLLLSGEKVINEFGAYFCPGTYLELIHSIPSRFTQYGMIEHWVGPTAVNPEIISGYYSFNIDLITMNNMLRLMYLDNEDILAYDYESVSLFPTNRARGLISVRFHQNIILENILFDFIERYSEFNLSFPVVIIGSLNMCAFEFDDDSIFAYHLCSMIMEEEIVRYAYPEFYFELCTDDDEIIHPTFVKVYPNPVINSTIHFKSNTVSQNTTVSIFNIKGQLIKTLSNQSIKDNESVFIWDGLIDSKRVSNGIYLYRVKTENATQSGKFLILK